MDETEIAKMKERNIAVVREIERVRARERESESARKK